MQKHSTVVSVLALLVIVLLAINAKPTFANSDSTGGTSSSTAQGPGYAYGFPITISASGSLQSIGVDWAGTQSGNVMVALYSAGSGKPANLLAQSSSVAMSTTLGWQDIAVSSYSITAGSYWVAAEISATKTVYKISSSESYYSQSFGSFDSTWSSSSTQLSSGSQWNMRVTYSTGPPPSDFTITASPTSQSVAAGGTATYTLNIQYSSTLTATVNFSVTSGCPSGVTCTVSPNSVTGTSTATLSVPTLISTPSGTISVTVTASSSSPSLTHTVTVQLTIAGPGSYPFNVHAGATQVVVTVAWTGSGAATVYLSGPGGTPTLTESGQVVYDRITYTSGSTTPTNIHRVTFNISSYTPSSPQTWTVLVSLSASYTVTMEVT